MLRKWRGRELLAAAATPPHEKSSASWHKEPADKIGDNANAGGKKENYRHDADEGGIDIEVLGNAAAHTGDNSVTGRKG
jgi:hypothetical protein